MTTTLRSALLAAAVAAAVSPAFAQPSTSAPPAAGGAANQGPRGPGALFDEMDANKDSRVGWDEAWAFVQRRFNAADADRDGGLTRQEAEALRPAGRRPGGPRGGDSGGPSPAEQAARQSRFGDVVFRGLDANRDGRVTLDEVRPAVEARFRGLDADGNNAVERSELPQRPARSGQNQGNQAPAAPSR